jgi:hypothetical protein
LDKRRNVPENSIGKKPKYPVIPTQTALTNLSSSIPEGNTSKKPSFLPKIK